MYSTYTMIHWMFFFYFYCFFGWCFESTYVSLKSRKLVNRGFMRGPFLPIYGSGAIMMLVVSMPFRDNPVLVYIAGCIGATVLEYVTGVTMEALFKVRYWDYSKQPFNFQGHVCLGSTLAWGLLTILMTSFIHKPIERFVLSISLQVLTPITMIITAVLCADFALSFKAALDLKDILIKMENVKEDMLHIQKRLDVLIAVVNEELENRKDDIAESISQHKVELTGTLGTKVEDVKEEIEERLDKLKNLVVNKSSVYVDNVKEELIELRVRYMRGVESREHISSLKDFFQRDILRSNPTMSSKRFQEALEELKKRAQEKREK